jgi:2,3-dihydroxybenzoate decarboxylase
VPTKKVAVEEAFSIGRFGEAQHEMEEAMSPAWADHVAARIADLTDLRLREMDEQGIDVQVLSLTAPGIQGMQDTADAVAAAREANDLVAGVVREHPGRFAAFAALACQDPAAAVDELERAVTRLGMKGALINGHTHGSYLDEQRHWGLWEAAEALGVPIYIHPTDPPAPVACCTGYPLDRAAWGWAFETGSHALRVILAGVFDRYPGATVLLGHMGELLPYSLARLDDRYAFYEAAPPIVDRPSDYVRRNIVVTTSGVNDAAPLRCAIEALGADRVLFAVDYPYQRNDEAVTFIDSVDIADEDRERICHGNAERLLGL